MVPSLARCLEMKLLREYIREVLLSEAAQGVQNLGQDVQIAMEQSRGRVKFYYYVRPGLSKERRPEKVGTMWSIGDRSSSKDPVVQPRGQIELMRTSSRARHGALGAGPCDGAWEVVWAAADHAWGPLLYDVAMEWATMNGGGLISDRSEVSPESRAVWDYYFNKIQAAKSYQLDDLENTLTPEEKDNCNQLSAKGIDGTDSWQDSPLSKRYTKPPAVWNQLIKGNKLVKFDEAP